MKIIGHRGAKGLASENTLAAFQKALEHHADELEFDLRVTADNTVVVHHDPYLTDPSGNRLAIQKTSLAELRKHKADLLSFEELLGALPAPVQLLAEIKPHEPLEPIISLLRREFEVGRPAATVAVASFDQSILRTLHAAFPQLQLVVNERWSGVRGSWRARQVGTKRLAMRSWWLWRGFLRGMHRSGYQVAAYTMNDPAKVRRWQPYLYGVITDYPDRFEPPAAPRKSK